MEPSRRFTGKQSGRALGPGASLPPPRPRAPRDCKQTLKGPAILNKASGNSVEALEQNTRSRLRSIPATAPKLKTSRGKARSNFALAVCFEAVQVVRESPQTALPVPSQPARRVNARSVLKRRRSSDEPACRYSSSGRRAAKVRKAFVEPTEVVICAIVPRTPLRLSSRAPCSFLWKVISEVAVE